MAFSLVCYVYLFVPLLELISQPNKTNVSVDEEKSLIAKFGEGATKSGATLKGIFEKAIGSKKKKKKKEEK